MVRTTFPSTPMGVAQLSRAGLQGEPAPVAVGRRRASCFQKAFVQRKMQHQCSVVGQEEGEDVSVFQGRIPDYRIGLNRNNLFFFFL